MLIVWLLIKKKAIDLLFGDSITADEKITNDSKCWELIKKNN